MNKQTIWLLLNIVMTSITLSAICQPTRGPLVISPEIKNDKTIVFRYLAPRANDVKLSAQFEKSPVAMNKAACPVLSAIMP